MEMAVCMDVWIYGCMEMAFRSDIIHMNQNSVKKISK